MIAYLGKDYIHRPTGLLGTLIMDSRVLDSNGDEAHVLQLCTKGSNTFLTVLADDCEITYVPNEK